MQEFHIHKSIRDKYQLDQSLYELDGNVIFANVQAVRKFVQTINQSLDPATAAEKNITTSQINALGLIDEILHYIFAQYRSKLAPTALLDAYHHLSNELGEERTFQTIYSFCQEFPPIDVYQKAISLNDYLSRQENQLSTLEEMILLNLANRNPAFMQYGDFFDDTFLSANTAYVPMMKSVEKYFASLPGFGPDHQDIITMLHSPAVISPYSLEGQLQYIRSRWGELVQGFLLRILGGEDLIKEETKAIFAGPGPVHIPDYDSLRIWIDLETERFSPDSDWMPRLVLIAKNSYVWLYQLSKKYQRSITHLDQIPDEELDILAASGITGLWLIGLWERSKASENIKKMCGNPEAVASAYSIMDYRIADDLGGHAALENLKSRAWQRGIRLASDMVPNHMGIDSNWLIDHPEYFVSVSSSPYPAYRFEGPNLSPANHVGIYLEDHYFDRSDAAVVFKRVDHSSGEVQYIYHGNDGTTMPWNDTAQLNYLSAQVREEVIQLILRVARDFPVIRFDAAMTLAKKHYQRLWFPEPGHGGAIPSRSEHAIFAQEFHRVFPEEFWREVVDRVAREVPDTLLLAEAFWLMESYFVRTLGMHRVYNSAFMNMLRNEENAKYRALMKNTLEFDPEILKRFVNFMNNPDERTAVDQFGKGDKYFGICTLMVTLPGLPMFGHGQVEGYSEKYGMEYRKAYLDESPDEDLINRHRWQVFPLTHQRFLFSGVEHFYLYDFFRENGTVDEDVYAYSNGAGNHRALVIFHNKFAATQGWIKSSASRLNKGANKLQQVSIGEGLELHNSDRHFAILHDQVSSQEILYRCDELFEKGCFFQLDAYTCRVFNSIQEVEDFDGSWAALYGEIGGRLTRDIFYQYKIRRFRELHHHARELFRCLLHLPTQKSDRPVDNGIDPELNGVDEKSKRFYHSLSGYAHLGEDRTEVACQNFNKIAHQILDQHQGTAIAAFYGSAAYQKWLETRSSADYPEGFEYLEWIWGVMTAASSLTVEEESSIIKSWFDEFSLAEPVIDCLREMNIPEPEIESLLTILSSDLALLSLPINTYLKAEDYLQRLFTTEATSRMLGTNSTDGVVWFRKESFEDWIAWKQYSSPLSMAAAVGLTWSEKLEWWIKSSQMMDMIQKAIGKSNYQVDQLLDLCRITSEDQ